MDTSGWPPERWALLGETIAKSRRAKGWDQQRLAQESSTSSNTISNYERGRAGRTRRVPTGYRRVAIALGWPAEGPQLILSGEDPATVIGQQNLFDLGSPEESGRAQPSASPTAREPWLPKNLANLNSRDLELTQSGYMAQDMFVRQMRRYRKLQGVSLEELAMRTAHLGGSISLSDLKRLEMGTRVPQMGESQIIAAALDTSVEWLLGSAFSSEAPEQLRQPPTVDELESEAKAMLGRLGEMGSQVLAARHQLDYAREREAHARQETEMAMAMVQSISAQERDMERQYQYLLGRIDSIRAAAGEPTVMEVVPVYEESDDSA